MITKYDIWRPFIERMLGMRSKEDTIDVRWTMRRCVGLVGHVLDDSMCPHQALEWLGEEELETEKEQQATELAKQTIVKMINQEVII